MKTLASGTSVVSRIRWRTSAPQVNSLPDRENCSMEISSPRAGALSCGGQSQRTEKSWVAVFPFRRVRARRKPIVQKDDVAGSRKGRHRSGAARAEAPLRRAATPRNWLAGPVLGATTEPQLAARWWKLFHERTRFINKLTVRPTTALILVRSNASLAGVTRHW